MASSASTIPLQLPNRWLPYFAIFDMDLRQTLRSGIFRGCVLLLIAFCAGYLIHFIGMFYKGQLDLTRQSSDYFRLDSNSNVAAIPIIQFLNYSLIFGIAIVSMLSANAISGEKGNMADVTLCRGVGRYQYFLGKIHSRFTTIMGAYFILGLLMMLISIYTLPGKFTYAGTFTALILVGSILTFVLVGCISVGSLTSNTLVTLGIVLSVMYLLLAALWLFPVSGYSLSAFMGSITSLIVGYNGEKVATNNIAMLRLAGWILLYTGGLAAISMYFFGRKDV